jgi:hypothetical protein
MLADIGHEFVKLSALDQRKDVSERMKLKRGHLKSFEAIAGEHGVLPALSIRSVSG